LEIEKRNNYEIKNHTTFKIGGVVDCVYLPKNQEEFIYLLKNLENYIVLGNCSNILISSSGYSGNIILTTGIQDFSINGTTVFASCGVKGPLLAQKTCDNSLSGFEFMIGFPGTIGGEIYMNASAHNQAISDTLKECCLFDKKTKEIIYKTKSEMLFGYRTSLLQKEDYILLSATFELKKSDKNQITDLIERNKSFRKEIQPSLSCPNAGSVFKNPINDSAGRLLDKAGVKNIEKECVAVWKNHANFIINKKNATSMDVLNLIKEMQTLVENNYTIKLEPEIIYIGNKDKKEVEICKTIYQKKQK
jgi:UDP-N-acetylmuramate dehydrogenase